jgi:hypothetical protein
METQWSLDRLIAELMKIFRLIVHLHCSRILRIEIGSTQAGNHEVGWHVVGANESGLSI